MLRQLILISFVFLLMIAPVSATHLFGGEMYYECLNPSTGLYLISVKLYRDCYTGVPPFDDPIYVSIYRRDSLGNDTLFDQMEIIFPGSNTLDNHTYNICLYAPPNICIEEAVYQQSYILPPGRYYFTYQRCCRNQGIVNIPNPTSTGFGFDIGVPDTNLAMCNSSPSYNNYPPTIICLDTTFEYDHSATDPDGDSLVYFLCAPNDYNTAPPPAGYGIVPNPSGPPISNLTMSYINPYDSLYPIWAPIDSFKIDPVTGLLTGSATQTGRYLVAVCVSEYREGVLLSTNSRDFQFNVAACLDDSWPPQFTWVTDSIDSCMVNFSYLGNPKATFGWDFGVDSLNSDTSGLENPSYTFPGSGTYTVSLIVNEGHTCADTVDMQVSINQCNYVLVPEFGDKNETLLRVYPNPTRGIFTINLEGYANKGNLQLNIYHIDGTNLLQLDNLTFSNGTVEINLSDLAPGAYFLKAELGGETFVRKIILQ